MQGTRNRRGAHAERIDSHAELAQLFLLLHAELLLFVNHEQAQVLELVFLAQKRVRTDDNVNFPFGYPLENLAFFLCRLVAVHERDVHGESRKTVAEVFVMLGGKDGRRHENRDLLFRGNALEGGAHGDFRLPESHVTADKAVHRPPAFHVPLYFGGSLHLVGSRVVLECVLEFLLHLAIGRERKTVHKFALRIKVHEVARNLYDLLLHALLQVFPGLAAQAVELRGFFIRNFQTLNLLQVRYRELQAVATLVFEQGAVHETAVHFHAHKPEIAAHAVILVSNVVPAVQRFHHQRGSHGARYLALPGLCRMTVENPRFGEERHLVVVEPEPFGKVSDKVILDRQSRKHVLESRQSTGSRCNHIDLPATCIEVLDFLRDFFGTGACKILRARLHAIPVGCIGLHMRDIHRSMPREGCRNFTESPPNLGRRLDILSRRAKFLECGIVGLVQARSVLGKRREFLEHEAYPGKVIQQAGIQLFITPAFPPDAGKFTVVLGKFRIRERPLTHRVERHALHGLHRALREDVETADRFNLVTEKFNTDRVRVQKTVHVHDAPAYGELAYRAHHRLLRKSVVQEPRAECGRLEHVAHLQHAHVACKPSRRREFHQQSIERAYRHDRLLRIARIPEKPQALFDYALEGDLLLVWPKTERREKADEFFAHEALEVFHPDFGTLEILRDYKNRTGFLEKALGHHHRCQRDGRPVHVYGFAPRLRKGRKRRNWVILYKILEGHLRRGPLDSLSSPSRRPPWRVCPQARSTSRPYGRRPSRISRGKGRVSPRPRTA